MLRRAMMAQPSGGGGGPGGGGDVFWTNRGGNTVSISGNSITLNAETSGSGFTGANAYSQDIDFSGMSVGSKVTAAFTRVYSGSWWDDNFINAGFVTCLWLRKTGPNVLLDSGQWNYQRVSNGNEMGLKIEWRRTYDLPPKIIVVTAGTETVATMMTQVTPGSPIENTSCDVVLELTWVATLSMKCDIYINGVHRYTATITGTSAATTSPTTGCFFVHAHNYGGAATVAVNDASVTISP